MGVSFEERHAIAWIADHAEHETFDRAQQYAAWYVENYPEGDKSHADAYWYWLRTLES